MRRYPGKCIGKRNGASKLRFMATLEEAGERLDYMSELLESLL